MNFEIKNLGAQYSLMSEMFSRIVLIDPNLTQVQVLRSIMYIYVHHTTYVCMTNTNYAAVMPVEWKRL